ncbi:MAG: hypothetical protein H7238_09345 [Polaromonas sp.]|nr:hypothetical protein [Polaromonas sp.]
MPTIAEAKKLYPYLEGYSDNKIVDMLQEVEFPDLSREHVAKVLGVKPPEVAPVERTWGEAATDTGRGVMSGLAGLVKTGGDLYGLASGNMENPVSELGKNAQEYWTGGQSQALKDKIKVRDAKIDEAEGILGKAGAAIYNTVKEPALMADMAASNISTMLPGALVARPVQGAMMARALAAGPITELAAGAAAKTAAKVATGVSVGTGAIQQGADVSSQAYDDSIKKTAAELVQNPEFVRRISFGPDGEPGEAPKDVAMSLGLSAARAAFLPAAAISVATNALPGGTMLERALIGGAARNTIKAGVKYALPKAMIKGGLGEASTEFLEEGGGQFAANVAKQKYVDPNQDLSADVGKNAGLGFAGGLAMGVPAGAMHRQHSEVQVADPIADAKAKRDTEMAPLQQRVSEQPNNSALTRATLAGNTGAAADAELLTRVTQEQQAATDAAAPDASATASAEVAATLEQRTADIVGQAKGGAIFAALRAPESPVSVREFVGDLSIAQAQSARTDLREKALGRLQVALDWAGNNPAAPATSQIEQIVGEQTGGVARSTPTTAAQRQAGVDRDSELLAQLASATTEFDRQQIRAQLDANASMRLGRTSSEQEQAAAPARATGLNAEEQGRLESAAAAGQAPPLQTSSASADAALKRIADRNGVASVDEANLLKEAGYGAPYDNIDPAIKTGAGPSQGQVRSSTKLEGQNTAEQERIAELDAANATGKRKADPGQAATDAPAAATVQSPYSASPQSVSRVFSVPAFQRTAEDKLTLAAAKKQYTPEQLALLDKVANSAPFSLSTDERLSMRTMQEAHNNSILQSSSRESEAVVAPPANAAQDVATPNVATPAGAGPAVFRKRRAALLAIAGNGLTTVERRNDGQFYMVDGSRKRQYQLSGPADAALARKAVKDYVDGKAHAAATSPTNNLSEPTGAKIDAVNWKKGDRFQLNGQTLVIENPAGSTRKSKPDAEQPWENQMVAHYGDIAGTRGADGDPVDVFVGPDPATPKIFVVDQVNKDGTFDEHKVMMGYADETAARDGYLANYGKGWAGLGAITEMAPAQFNTWVKSEATQQPLGALNGATRSDTNGAIAGGNEAATADAGGGVADRRRDAGLQDAGRASGATAVTEVGRANAVADGGQDASPGHVTINDGGVERDIALVSPVGEANSATRIGRAQFIGKTHARLIQSVAGMFGKKVQFYSDAKLGDGFVMDSKPDTIFMKDHSTIHPLAVFGHELLHLMAKSMPEAHEALVTVITKNMTPDAAHKFRNDYHGRNAGPNSNQSLNPHDIEELTSDVGGNLMSDPAFWGEVMAQIQKDNPAQAKTLIAEFAHKFMELINKLMSSVQQNKFMATSLMKDMTEVRSAFRDGLAKYAASNGVSPAAMGVAVAKAGQVAKQSPLRDNAADDQRPTRTTDVPGRNDTPRGLGQASDAGNGGLGGTPSYGSPRPGAVSALGRHYSTGVRQALSGSAFGRGLKGAERDRLAESDDPRIKQRVNFYVDLGQGITPESGVGAYAHEVKLNNLYDASTKTLKYTGGSNNFESAVIDAGYDGYMVRNNTTKQGAVVLLGKAANNIPVQAIGQPKNAPLAPDQEPTSRKKALTGRELSNVNVDAIPGSALKNGNLVVPAGQYDAANQELERIGSPIRFSPARASDSPAAEYAKVEAKYKGTDGWLKAPNGEATKLNERQWVHTRTPAFQNWFGDWESYASKQGGVWSDGDRKVSKVVDANGEPLVVYHGANAGGFSEFNKPGGKVRGDVGIFTSDSWNTAGSYITRGRAKTLQPEQIGSTNAEVRELPSALPNGNKWVVRRNGGKEQSYYKTESDAYDAMDRMHDKQPGVYALFMNLRNPGETSFEGAHWSGDARELYNVMLNADEEPYTNKQGKRNFSQEEAMQLANELNGEIMPASGPGLTTDMAVREANQYGHDGAMISEVVDDGPGATGFGDPSNLFVAFDPNQLKSADFNGGEYSVGKNDIRQSTQRDPAIGDRTDVDQLPKGKPIPASASVGSLENSLEQARSKSYATGRQLKIDIQEKVLAAAKAAKVNLSERTQETFKFLSDLVVRDAQLALQSNENAIGWYDKTVSRAIGALSTIHPELETDPKSRLAFMWALATTSNGLKVGINFKLAEEAYRNWKSSNSDPALRIMPTDIGIGNAKGAINKGLALYNTLRADMGDDRLFKFMATEFQVGEIKRMLGEAPGGEWMPTPVLGSAVLGPKIGNGFFSNLNGYFSALTMDRWLMRTWGRMTGTLMDLNPVTIDKSRTKLAVTISALSDPQRKQMSKLIGTPIRRAMTRAELDAVSKAIVKATMKPGKRELMAEAPATDQLRLDGNGHAKNLDGQKEAPSGPAERNWIRAVFTKSLAELNKGDQPMTMSDLQALLWYPERRLYDAAKSDEVVSEGYEDNEAPDYANAAQQLALKNGISPKVVDAAMDKAEKRGTVKGESLSADEKAALLKELRASPEQSVQLAFEVAPDPANVELTAQWAALSFKDRTEITAKVKAAVVNDVVDALGLKVGKTVGAVGGFGGAVNPNLIMEYVRKELSIQEARALSAALGMALDQDSVALVDHRAAQTNGMVRVNLSVKAGKHAEAILRAIQAVAPGSDSFTARGNNFDVLNFPGGTTTEALHDKIVTALENMEADFDASVSFGNSQSELVEKDAYESHINGLRPGSGQEIRGRIERARDRAREIVATEIRSAVDRGLQPGARPRTGRAAVARLDDVRLSPERDAEQSTGRTDAQPVQEPGGFRGGDGILAGTRRPYQRDGRQGTTLEGLPARIEVDGKQIVFAGFKPAQDAAAAYMQEAGMDYSPPKTYTKVDAARATRIANAFEAMANKPTDPQVKASYQAMIQETLDQYQEILKTGLKVEFNDGSDPYGNPRNAILDVVENNHLFVFSTQDGFGSSALDVSANPLLAETEFKFGDKPTLANDIFRVVHDYFGHIKEGVGFRAAQPLSAKVLTPAGWTEMGQINIGDQVINPDGGTSTVTQIHPHGMQRVYEVKFNDGSSTRCDSHHRWKVRWARDEAWMMKRTFEIAEFQKTCTKRLSIPMVQPVEFALQAPLPLDPYVVGVLLGDGHIGSSVSFFSDDQEIAERVGRSMPAGVSLKKRVDRNEYLLSTGVGSYHNPVCKIMQELGLQGARAHDKFIPDKFKFSSPQDRLELLRGLMDTDGNVSSKPGVKYTVAKFRTVSEVLAKDIQFLTRSLGGTARIIRAEESTYIYRGEARAIRAIYTVGVNLPEGVNPFFVERKATALIRKNQPARAIVSVTEVEAEAVQCITVDSLNELYITDDFIVTMNSGEENAWRSHASMYSPLAQRAMTTETRGQNSWVNYGPKADFNRTANGGDTVYADQKVGLLPQWVTDEGATDASAAANISLSSEKTSDKVQQQKIARPEELIELRKRKSVLESILKCMG